MSANDVQGPELVEAELFIRRMTNGRNRPILVSAASARGPVQCVVKLAKATENPGLVPLPYLLEWLGAALAGQLRIPAGQPYEVTITRAFAEAVHAADPEMSRFALASLGSAFGSEFAGPPLTQWTADMPHNELKEPAANLVAFDAYIHNPDRRVGNPNLLVGRHDVFAFDHSDAFSFLYAITSVDPASDPLLPVLDHHALRGWVRQKGIGLERFRARLELLTDDVFEAIVAATPQSWQEGPAAGKLQVIIEVLRRRRDAVDQWLPRVEAWLEK